jgi:hypothetical protein
MGTRAGAAEEILPILAGIASELTPAVASFLHGGPPGRLPAPANEAQASITLRRLHDALDEADRNRRGKYVVAVLSAAVRLQAVILYEVLKEKYGAYAGSA